MLLTLGELRSLIREKASEIPFEKGDRIRFGKYKNKKGKLASDVYDDEKGHATIDIEPVPKGRKDNVEMGLFKIWPEPDEDDVGT